MIANHSYLRRLTLLAVAINLAITVPLAYLLNVWQDDAYTLNTTGSGLGYALHQSIFFEQNAPLYFLLMTLWRHLDGSYFFARLFSVFCAAATLYLIPKIVRRYVPRVSPVWITFAIALNPFLIWAALEIRLYAFVIFLSACLLVTFYDAFLSPARTRGAPFLYCAVCIVAIYTQYYLAFLILAQSTILLATNRRSALRYLYIVAIVALAFLPMALAIPAQLASFRGSFASPASPLHSSVTLAEIVLQYVLPLASFPHYRVLYGVVIAAALIGALLFHRSLRERADLRLPAITGASFIIFALAVYSAKEHVLNRHGAMLLIPVVVSVYAVLARLNERARKRAVMIWTGVVLLCSVITLYGTYRPMAKAGDWARVTYYIAQRERAGQPIVIFEAENAVPFEYYYRGPNAVVAVPTAVDFQSYNVDRFVLSDEAQIERALRLVPGKHDTIWLVTGDFCRSLNIDFGCATLERYVARHYKVSSERHFFKSDVRLLRRRGAAPTP